MCATVACLARLPPYSVVRYRTSPSAEPHWALAPSEGKASTRWEQAWRRRTRSATLSWPRAAMHIPICFNRPATQQRQQRQSWQRRAGAESSRRIKTASDLIFTKATRHAALCRPPASPPPACAACVRVHVVLGRLLWSGEAAGEVAGDGLRCDMAFGRPRSHITSCRL